MQNDTATPDLRKLPEVCRQTGLSGPTVYRLAHAGKFPKPIKITTRASAWVGTEVDEWVRNRIAEARDAA